MRVALAWCLLSTAALAQNEELTNPGSVAAVQSRAYRLKAEFDLVAGVLPIDAFTKQVYGQLQFVYHFTDAFAWQVGRGAYGYNIDTGLRAELERLHSVVPTTIDKVQFFVGSDVMFTPFYGKTALFNSVVLFYEAYVLLGATVFKYTHAFRPAVNLGGGVRLFQNEHVSYRLEVTDNVVIKEKPEQVLQVNIMLALNFGG